MTKYIPVDKQQFDLLQAIYHNAVNYLDYHKDTSCSEEYYCLQDAVRDFEFWMECHQDD